MVVTLWFAVLFSTVVSTFKVVDHSKIKMVVCSVVSNNSRMECCSYFKIALK